MEPKKEKLETSIITNVAFMLKIFKYLVRKLELTKSNASIPIKITQFF